MEDQEWEAVSTKMSPDFSDLEVVPSGTKAYLQAVLIHLQDMQNRLGDLLISSIHKQDKSILESLSKVWDQIPQFKIQKALEATIVENDCHMADYLLSRGAKVSCSIEDFEEKSYLHMALELESYEVARTLIKAGVDLNKKNHNGETALHLISETACLPLMIDLIQLGADEKAVNIYNQNCLFYAAFPCQPGYTRTLKYLLNKGVLNVNTEDSMGNNMLYCKLPKYSEAIVPDCDVVAVLITHGILIRQVDERTCSCDDYIPRAIDCPVNLIVAKILSLSYFLGQSMIGKLQIFQEIVDHIQFKMAKQLSDEICLMLQVVVTPKHQLFDLIKEPRNELQKLYKNQNSANTMKIIENDLTTKFSVLGDLLMTKLKKAQLRAEKTQSCLVIADQVLGHQLPFLVLDEILSNLSNLELQCFIDATELI